MISLLEILERLFHLDPPSRFAFVALYILIVAILFLPSVLLMIRRRADGGVSFAVKAGRTAVICSAVSVAAALIPRDYCRNPPGTPLVSIPRGAEMIACYSLDYDCQNNKVVRGPLLGKFNCMGDTQSVLMPWFRRRGFSRFAKLDVGDRALEYEEAIARPVDAITRHACYAVFRVEKNLRAVAVICNVGASSGYGLYAKASIFSNGKWETEREEKERHTDGADLDEFFAPVVHSANAPFISSAGAFLVLLIARFIRRGKTRRIGHPLLLASMGLLMICFLQLASFPVAFAIAGFTIIAQSLQIAATVCLIATIPMALAYAAFRIAKKTERRDQAATS